MSEALIIRSYRAADLPALKAITVAAFDGVSIDRNIEEQFGAINGHDWRWRKQRHIADDVQRDPKGVFVAEIGDRIVGYITTFSDRQSGIGFIPNLAVDESERGKGIGRRLIQHGLDHFREQGLSHARIETLAQNAVGQALYPSLGFVEVARQIHYCLNLNDARL